MLSISTMASIAVDRFMSITKWQLWHLTYRHVALWVSGLWLYSFALVIPPILGWSAYVLEGVQTSCTFDFLSRTPATIGFTCWLFFIGFCVPVCVIIACYTKLVRYITDHQKAMDDAGLGPDAPSRSRVYTNRSEPGSERTPLPTPASEVKAATTCAVIVGLFCLAWTPYALVALISTFGRPDLVSPYVNSLPALFAKASAVYNPIVYALMNERFRRAVLVMLRLRRPSSRHRFPGSVPPIHSAQQRKSRLLSTTSTTFSTTSTTFCTPTSPTGIAPTGLQRSSIDEGQEEEVELEDNRRDRLKKGMRLSLDGEPTVILEDTGTVGFAEIVGSREEGMGDDELLLTPTPMTECFGCSVAHAR
nr:rhabdomeric opsin [Paramacrobiotus richtersi]